MDSQLLTKTFGSGLAFPMRTNDGQIIPDTGKANPRADSFALYLNFVANQQLQNLLPKTKLDSKLQKTLRQDKKPEVAKSLVRSDIKPAVPKQITHSKPAERSQQTP